MSNRIVSEFSAGNKEIDSTSSILFIVVIEGRSHLLERNGDVLHHRSILSSRYILSRITRELIGMKHSAPRANLILLESSPRPSCSNMAVAWNNNSSSSTVSKGFLGVRGSRGAPV